MSVPATNARPPAPRSTSTRTSVVGVGASRRPRAGRRTWRRSSRCAAPGRSKVTVQDGAVALDDEACRSRRSSAARRAGRDQGVDLGVGDTRPRAARRGCRRRAPARRRRAAAGCRTAASASRPGGPGRARGARRPRRSPRAARCSSVNTCAVVVDRGARAPRRPPARRPASAVVRPRRALLDGRERAPRGGRGGRRVGVARVVVQVAATSSAAHSPAHVLGVIAPMVTQPSAVSATPGTGAWLWCADPSGPPTSPVAKYVPASQTASETPDSSSETSTYWPAPSRSALAQRRGHRQRGVEAADQVAERDADLDRVAVRRCR